MSEKRLGQGGFADVFVASGAGKNKRLDRIDGLIDWRGVEKVLRPVRSKIGRGGYPALSLFKACLLAQWYVLSDPGLEEALCDRLSFRRFCGFGLSDETPDETTFVRFRQALRAHDLHGRLFDEINRQLDEQGLILRQGTLVDATLVGASTSRPKMGADQDEVRDKDANWTKRGSRSHYGYKVHVGTDFGSGLIRSRVLTPAKTYESEVGDELVIGDEAAVYADKAYEHKDRRRRLKSLGINDRIMHRSHKNQPRLPHWQSVRNKLISPIRAAVEQVFGLMKRSYGFTRVRYVGLEANAVHLDLLCIAINLRRAERLTA